MSHYKGEIFDIVYFLAAFHHLETVMEREEVLRAVTGFLPSE